MQCGRDSSPWTGATHVPVPMEVGRGGDMTWNCSCRPLWLAGHGCREVGSSEEQQMLGTVEPSLRFRELGFCAEVFWVLHLVSKHGHNGAYGRPQQFDGRLGKKVIPGEQLRITETAPPRCRMDWRARGARSSCTCAGVGTLPFLGERAREGAEERVDAVRSSSSQNHFYRLVPKYYTFQCYSRLRRIMCSISRNVKSKMLNSAMA